MLESKIVLSLKKLIFFRQHPEAAIRYYPIVKLLKKLKLTNSQILEVGSGSYGIAPYLKKNITGVDVDFSEHSYPRLKQVIGSATNLPFKNNQFAVVLLSDVLEHLPKKLREKAINEAIRVARKAVIISGPFGKESELQDKELAEYSVKKLGYMHQFFKDHLEYGLPEVENVKKIILKNKKVKSVGVSEEYFNLAVRRQLMKSFMSKTKIGYYFYLKGLMPLVPILRMLNKKPGYRKILYLRVD